MVEAALQKAHFAKISHSKPLSVMESYLEMLISNLGDGGDRIKQNHFAFHVYREGFA